LTPIASVRPRADDARRFGGAFRTIEDQKMKTSTIVRAVQAALIAAAVAGTSTAALADIKDYKFELVDQSVQAGPDKVVTVRLVNTKTDKPVPDAVIFASRLDMAPDGMQEMATKVTAMPGTEPGTYRFKASFGMAGRWQLSLGAKVQGETGTVENKLVITAQK
jgi:YtkA-like